MQAASPSAEPGGGSGSAMSSLLYGPSDSPSAAALHGVPRASPLHGVPRASQLHGLRASPAPPPPPPEYQFESRRRPGSPPAAASSSFGGGQAAPPAEGSPHSRYRFNRLAPEEQDAQMRKQREQAAIREMLAGQVAEQQRRREEQAAARQQWESAQEARLSREREQLQLAFDRDTQGGSEPAKDSARRRYHEGEGARSAAAAESGSVTERELERARAHGQMAAPMRQMAAPPVSHRSAAFDRDAGAAVAPPTQTNLNFDFDAASLGHGQGGNMRGVLGYVPLHAPGRQGVGQTRLGAADLRAPAAPDGAAGHSQGQQTRTWAQDTNSTLATEPSSHHRSSVINDLQQIAQGLHSEQLNLRRQLERQSFLPTHRPMQSYSQSAGLRQPAAYSQERRAQVAPPRHHQAAAPMAREAPRSLAVGRVSPPVPALAAHRERRRAQKEDHRRKFPHDHLS